MPLRPGGLEARKVYSGATRVKAVHIGTSKAWPVDNLMTANPSFETAYTGLGSNATAVVDTAWAADGLQSLKVTPNAASTGSLAMPCGAGAAGGPSMALLGMQPGKTYMVSATCRLFASQLGTNTLDQTNLAWDPISDTSNAVGTFWAPSRATVTAPTGYRRLTINDATAASHAQRLSTPVAVGAASRVIVTAGETIRAIAQARSSVSFSMITVIQWFDAAGAFISSSIGAGVTTNPTTFVDVPEATGIAPANATYCSIQIGINGAGARAINDTIDIRHVGIYKGLTTLPYFDGTTLVDQTYSYKWSGTAQASTSERRLLGTGLHTNARRIHVGTIDNTGALINPQVSAQPPNLPGAYRLAVPYTVPLAGTFRDIELRLYNGSQTAGDIVYWDAVLVEEAVPVNGRVNRCVNPTAETVGSNALCFRTASTSAYPFSASTTTPIQGAVSGMTTRVAAQSPSQIIGNFLFTTGEVPSPDATAQFAVTPGEVYTFGVDAKSDVAGGTFRTRAYWYDAAKVFLSSSPVVIRVSSVVANQVYRVIETTEPAPAGAMFCYVSIFYYTASGNALDGQRVWADRLTIENGVTDGSWFDYWPRGQWNPFNRMGGTSNESWERTPAGHSLAGCTIAQSTDWALDGIYSGKVTADGTAGSAYYSPFGQAGTQDGRGLAGMGLERGKTYTVSCSLYMPQLATNYAVQPPRLAFLQRLVGGATANMGDSANALNQIGVQRLKCTFTVPMNIEDIALWMISGTDKPAGEAIYWDGMCVEEGVTAGNW